MTQYDFDYFVIGGGSGGVRSARIAASHGAKVALVEEKHLGGTCVNVGCVPKKLLAYAGHFAHDFEDAKGFGWDVGTPTHDWARLIDNKNTEIARLNGIYEKMLVNGGVEVLRGRAILVDDHTIDVGPDRYTADKILIATGGYPNKPDHPGAEHAIVSDDFFYIKERPEKALLIGGGYISLEFACILQSLGTEVTVFHRGDKLLRGFDEDMRDAIAEELIKQGINLVLNSPGILSIEKDVNGQLMVNTNRGEQECYDEVLYGIGRTPHTEGLGLETTGIDTNAEGAIIVNDNYQTSVPNIYALGDVTNRLNLTPVALAEGHVLADNLFNKQNRSVSYENIPTAIFTTPPISTCGLTEAEAQEKHGKLRIYTSSFRPMKYTLSGRDEKTLFKLIVEDKTDKVLGCHFMGLDAPEMMQAIAIAMKMGATKADFDATIGIHPTAAEEFVTLRNATRTT
jgi:glutathione reductase (NADPH)